VSFNNSFGNGESQTGPPSGDLAGAREKFKDVRQNGTRNARTGIDYRKTNFVAACFDSNPNPSLGFRKFDRIANQVCENLSNPDRIAVDV